MPAGKLARSGVMHAFYSAHHGWLYAWLRRKLGCAENAADLAHDTFARVIARTQGRDLQALRLDTLREPRAFLTTIARGLVVDHWRRLAIERAYLEALAAQPESSCPSPEQRALVIEALLEVDAMLAALPDKPRRAFLMAQLDGLAYREIGAALGVSERMVKKYMAQAMQHCGVPAAAERMTLLAQGGAAARAALAASHSPGRRRALRTLAVVAAGGVGTLAALRMPWREWRHDLAMRGAAFRTGVGDVRAFALDDGSRIWLGSASALDVAYSARSRSLTLYAGDLVVETARDTVHPARPFVVETAHGRLRALGTRFAVRAEADSVRTDVFDGAVEVAPCDAASPRIVRAGEHAVFDRSRIVGAGKASAAREGWSRGMLLAESMALREVVAELARWHPVQLGCAPEVAGIEVVGVYPLRDIEVVLAALEASLPVEIERGNAGVRIVGARRRAPAGAPGGAVVPPRRAG